MDLMEIKDKLEGIEKEILKNSFELNKSLGKLSRIYFDLVKIKSEFLRSNFMEFHPAELEEIRYKINESILSVRIWIRENKGLNVDLEIRQMQELFSLYQ